MPITIPPVIVAPFADSGTRDPIPDTNDPATGRASYEFGFPDITMQPIVAGGIPPFGQDMNGILWALSVHAMFKEAGQSYAFDATVAAAIGGYPIGTLLISTDASTIWYNTTAANSTDPDASGTGWVAVFSYGIETVTGVNGGTVTLTQNQARRETIHLTGALVSNALVVLPTWVRSWRIVNACTGAFVVTVKTAAGTGVDVPAGGFASPVSVYGDGTNLYNTVSPLAYPIDVAQTPATIPLRNATGDIVARYFLVAAAAAAATIVNVFADSGDGATRRVPIATVRSQLLSGQVYSAPARFAFVVYTNTTGRPITVVVTAGFGGAGNANFLVDGSFVCGCSTSGGNQFVNTFVVPEGSTYEAQVAGALTVFVWRELS